MIKFVMFRILFEFDYIVGGFIVVKLFSIRGLVIYFIIIRYIFKIVYFFEVGFYFRIFFVL